MLLSLTRRGSLVQIQHRPLINYLQKRYFALTERGPGSASRPFCCNRSEDMLTLALALPPVKKRRVCLALGHYSPPSTLRPAQRPQRSAAPIPRIALKGNHLGSLAYDRRVCGAEGRA